MKILAVEDDASLLRGLQKGLVAHGFAVDTAATAAGALDLVAVNPYDVVVLDLGLPDFDGLTLVRTLRARGNQVPVLVLSARGEVEDRVAGLEHGADDYLRKPFAFSELLARIRALLRRQPTLAPSVLEAAGVELDPSRLSARRAGATLVLTPKEFAILEHLMRNPDRLVTRTDLLERCWDATYDGLSNLVDVHVGRLRRKLDSAGEPPLIRTVRGAGYIFGSGPR